MERPALGQVARIGALYDGRTDSFSPTTIHGADLLPQAVELRQNPGQSLSLRRGKPIADKFSHLRVGRELGLSFLAGFGLVDGYGAYLKRYGSSDRLMDSSIHFGVIHVEESVNLNHASMRQALDLDTLKAGAANHVVTAITWGAQMRRNRRRHLGGGIFSKGRFYSHEGGVARG